MAAHSARRSRSARLIALNQEAFAATHYHTAYHALAAALHEAVEERNPVHLARVQHLAEAQLAWIDGHAPAYEHSTASAQTRGHTSIFALLAQQAQAKIQLLQRASQEEPPHP